MISRDVFQFLQITPSKYWDQLLWMDQENYGGMEIKEGSEEIDDDKEEQGPIDDSDSDEEGFNPYNDSEAEQPRRKAQPEIEGTADGITYDEKKSKSPHQFLVIGILQIFCRMLQKSIFY